jgi:hypothetical protein
LKAFFAFEERHLRASAFRDVAENHDVLARQAIGLGRELHENRGLVVFHKLGIALLELLGEETLPAFLELVGILIKPGDRFADQLRATNSEELLGCGVGLATDRLVIKDQNGIQRILKD